MIAFLKRLWRAAPIATLILGLALGATGIFAVRATLFAVRWHDPANREVQIEGWMTPGFVAHSWHVPPEVVLDAIGAPRKPNHPMSFYELAAKQRLDVSQLIDAANDAIAQFRADHMPPAPPPPAPAPEGGE